MTTANAIYYRFYTKSSNEITLANPDGTSSREQLFQGLMSASAGKNLL